MKYSLRYKISNALRKFGIALDAEKQPAVQNMWKTIRKLDGGKILFELSLDKDGDWSAIAVNLPGLMTGGSLSDPISDMIEDAIFTYFAIPPEYCDERILNKNYVSQHKSKRSHVDQLYNLRECSVA